MAKPHWQVLGENGPQGFGCQHADCHRRATVQWRRAATDTEVYADARHTGPYGAVHRNPQGPHYTSVFACDDHAPAPDDMTRHHAHNCPAPDPGCDCE
jgi:hypothetical protein